jgi:hypothetical protein
MLFSPWAETSITISANPGKNKRVHLWLFLLARRMERGNNFLFPFSIHGWDYFLVRVFGTKTVSKNRRVRWGLAGWCYSKNKVWDV